MVATAIAGLCDAVFGLISARMLGVVETRLVTLPAATTWLFAAIRLTAPCWGG